MYLSVNSERERDHLNLVVHIYLFTCLQYMVLYLTFDRVLHLPCTACVHVLLLTGPVRLGSKAAAGGGEVGLK